MNLYAIRIRHNDTRIVYRHRIVAKSLSEALVMASKASLYTVIDGSLIRTNI
jgi:hypothetical protein